jgi:3'-phosphoadenosine 5'-phosphosulfate (PAPS) 3'-phosphatase
MDFSLFGDHEAVARASFAALQKGSLHAVSLREQLPSISTFYKPDGSPVTAADFVVQADVLSVLAAAFPDDIFLAEESLEGDIRPELQAQIDAWLDPSLDIRALFSRCPSVVPRQCRRYWAIDPIDGTSGYRRPPGHWVVAIALIEDGRCTFSGIGWPTAVRRLTNWPADEPLFYLASVGRGAFVTNGVEPLVRLRVPRAPRRGSW